MKELGCGMRMEGAHRHERKVGACEWRAHTDTKEKLVVCTPARLGRVTGACEAEIACRVRKVEQVSGRNCLLVQMGCNVWCF
jgi:hypothetical protein